MQDTLIKKVLMIFVVGIFLIGLASAFEFDNVKSVSKDVGTAGYKNIEIQNLFGFGGVLWKGELTKNTNTCGQNCEAQQTITLDKKGVLVSDIKFETILEDGSRIEQPIRSYQFYIKTDEEEYDVDDYGWVETGKLNVNGTAEVKWEKVGTHKEKKPLWTPYVLGSEVDAGTYEVKLEGSKKPSRKVDWIIKTQGEWLDEWAVWGESIYSTAEIIYSFEETSGVVVDYKGNYNGTNNGATRGIEGLIGNAFSYDGNDYIETGYTPTLDNFTFSLWINETSMTSGQVWIGSVKSGEEGFNIESQTNGVRLFIRNETGYAVTTGETSAVNDGTYHHILVRRDGEDVELWIDGALEKSGTIAGSIVLQGSIYIGAMNTIGTGATDYVTADGIDEFVMWEEALTNGDIASLYNGGSGHLAEFGSVTLNIPADESLLSSPEVDFNCSAEVTGGATLTNISLWHNGTGTFELNQTTSWGGLVTDAHGVAFTTTGDKTEFAGVRIRTNDATIIKTVTKDGSSGCTDAFILTEGEGQLATASFVGNNATFDYSLNADTTYLIGCNATGTWTGSWTGVAGYNISGTNFDWTGGWSSGAYTNTVQQIASITSDSGVTSAEEIFTSTISDTTLWNCQACDSDGDCGFATANYTVNLDATAPTITLDSPTGIIGYGEVGGNETLNVTFTDSNLDSCWYNYNGTNVSIGGCVSGTSNSTNFLLENGNTNITIYTNDSVGNLNTTEYFWGYRVFQISESYDENVTEGYTATFTSNVTWNSSAHADINAYLNYDGTRQSIADKVVDGDSANFTSSVIIPTVSSDTNKTFYWEYLLSGIYYNSTSDNQTVLNVAVDDCSVYSNVLFNFSLKDEELNTRVNGTSNSTLIEVDLDVYSGSTTIINYSNSFSETNPVTICSEDDLSSSGYEYNLIVSFSSADRVNEFWFVDAEDINSTTIPQNISLMDLLTADSTSFLFNYYDEDGLPVEDAIVHVMRKYVGSGTFLEVERARQDQNGDTIVHLVEEDVIYYFYITSGGETLYTTSTYTALCQATPCTITIEASGGTSSFDTDYDLIDGGSYTLTNNPTTREVELTYNLNESTKMNLTVYKYLSDGDYEVVATGSSTGFTDTITITVPQSAGNVSFFTAIERDDEFVNSEWINFEENPQSVFGTTLSLFLGVLIILTLGLMAVSEGGTTIIILILGVLLVGALGLITVSLSSGIGMVIYLVMAGGVILWKLTGGRR